MSLSEEQLVKQLQEGNEEAFRELMERFGTRLLRSAYLLLEDRYQAEDVVQEVFLTAYQKIKNFRGEAALGTWLTRITINFCRRKLKRSRWREVITADGELPEINEAELEAEVLARLQDTEIVQALRELPVKYREVLVMFYYQDLTVKEIAGVLEEKEGTVKSKLSRGRRIMKKHLQQGREDHD